VVASTWPCSETRACMRGQSATRATDEARLHVGNACAVCSVATGGDEVDE
jgi:hypothetical protein